MRLPASVACLCSCGGDARDIAGGIADVDLDLDRVRRQDRDARDAAVEVVSGEQVGGGGLRRAACRLAVELHHGTRAKRRDADLLGRGVYRPIADEITRAAELEAFGATPRVADLGCGTGYYSEFVANAHAGVRSLLADRSPDAVRAGLRSLPDATGVVMDVWRPFPIRTDAADVILNVFAPRNADEFARTLQPAGRLVVVVPSVDHLTELRDHGLLLDVPPEKATSVTDRFFPAGLVRRSATRVEYPIETDGELRRLLAGMGPSAHHTDSTAEVADDVSIDVTVSVDVLSFVHSAGDA